MTVYLSHYQARHLLWARKQGYAETEVSLDLNLSQQDVTLTPGGVSMPDGTILTWDQIETIRATDNVCFKLMAGVLEEIRVFSEDTNWVRSLYPTKSAPSTLVSGMVMHRIEGTDPMSDSETKIAAASPVTGHVLDTCTGLGYTAILAAKTASRVTTVELDPGAIDICRDNPWSAGLFTNERISLVVADVWDVIEETEDGSFSVIIHDPPTYQFAGDLYSGDFYAELYRVLSNRGRLFHYIGDPSSKIGGRMLKGVQKRLSDAGFRKVKRVDRAYGVLATK